MELEYDFSKSPLGTVQTSGFYCVWHWYHRLMSAFKVEDGLFAVLPLLTSRTFAKL